MRPDRIELPVLDAKCRGCGRPIEAGHDEECIFVEHEAMLAGDEDASMMHNQDGCYWCLATQPPVLSDCRCGDCCRQLLIEVDVEDSRREPKIEQRGSPILAPMALSQGGVPELIGFLLNREENGGACTFLDRDTNLCEIYGSRPLVCRLFDCRKIDSMKE